jgi:hypothetical protein
MFWDKKGGGGACVALYTKNSVTRCNFQYFSCCMTLKSANYIGARACVKKRHWVCTDTPPVASASVLFGGV